MARSLSRQPWRLGLMLSALPLIAASLFLLQLLVSGSGDDNPSGQQDFISATAGSLPVNPPAAGGTAGRIPDSSGGSNPGAQTTESGLQGPGALEPGYASLLTVGVPPVISQPQSGGFPFTPPAPPPLPVGTLYGNVWQNDVMDGPLGKITIYLADAHGTFLGTSVKTDQGGGFIFPALSPGSYKLYFFDSDNIYQPGWYGDDDNPQGVIIQVPSGGQKYIKYRMKGAQTSSFGTIAGRVTAAQKGVARAEVIAYVSDKSGANSYLKAKTITDENGYYKFDQLPATSSSPGGSGSDMGYKIYFAPPDQSRFAPQWYRGQPTAFGAKLLILEGGRSITDINAELAAGGTVSGSVTIDGRPAPFATVQIFNDQGIVINFIKTDTQGLYKSGQLAPAAYRVHVQAAGMQSDEWYSHQKSFAAADPVTVRENQDTPGINFVMESSRAPEVILLKPGQEGPAGGAGMANASVDQYAEGNNSRTASVSLPGDLSVSPPQAGMPDQAKSTEAGAQGTQPGQSTGEAAARGCLPDNPAAKQKGSAPAAGSDSAAANGYALK